MSAVRHCLSQQSCFALLILLGLGATSKSKAETATVVFEESCQANADREHPSSIVEIDRTPRTYGEVIGGRYAVNAGGNAHLLVTPRLKNFELNVSHACERCSTRSNRDSKTPATARR